MVVLMGWFDLPKHSRWHQKRLYFYIGLWLYTTTQYQQQQQQQQHNDYNNDNGKDKNKRQHDDGNGDGNRGNNEIGRDRERASEQLFSSEICTVKIVSITTFKRRSTDLLLGDGQQFGCQFKHSSNQNKWQISNNNQQKQNQKQ